MGNKKFFIFLGVFVVVVLVAGYFYFSLRKTEVTEEITPPPPAEVKPALPEVTDLDTEFGDELSLAGEDLGDLELFESDTSLNTLDSELSEIEKISL